LLEDQFRVFTDAGYKVKASVLSASDYGVAQDRKRIFIVGIRDDIDIEFQFPDPTHGTTGGLPKATLRDVIGHLPEWPDGEFYTKDFHWYYMSRDRYKGWNEQSRTIVANPRHMPLHPSSPRMVKHAHNDWRFEHDEPARRFTYREAAAIQGFGDLIFPDTESGSLTMRYTVAGNAVPPQLFEAVVGALPIEIWD
jgi:DNA (cytosine-5)-methyltransferase 1